MQKFKLKDLKIKKREDTTTWQEIKRSFLTGTLVLGPVAVTIFLLWKSFVLFDGILSRIVNKGLFVLFHFPYLEESSIPGLGLVALVVILILGGFAARNVFGQWFFARVQKTINKIPLVNRVYNAIQQISDAILSGRQEVFTGAVLIEYPRKGLYSIGITTTKNIGVVQQSIPVNTITVFIPTTPNPTSGFLVFVPESEITILDISVEDALKLIISGGTVNTPEEINQIQNQN